MRSAKKEEVLFDGNDAREFFNEYMSENPNAKAKEAAEAYIASLGRRDEGNIDLQNELEKFFRVLM